MSTTDPFPRSPQQIRTGTERSTTLYVRKPGYYAVHGRQPGTPAAGAAALLNEGAIAVFQGEPSRTEAASTTHTIGPVYALQPSDLLAIPTGLIFARFPTGTAAASRGEDINRAGYELVESPSYAPHAAWVRARSGKIADALANISALEQLPGVENVEPQMLMERRPR